MKTLLLLVLVCLVVITGCNKDKSEKVICSYGTVTRIRVPIGEGEWIPRELYWEVNCRGLVLETLLVKVGPDTLLQVNYFLTGGNRLDGTKRFTLKEMTHASRSRDKDDILNYDLSFEGGWSFGDHSQNKPVAWFFLRSRGDNRAAAKLIGS
ncbi:MAG: hypothetical protein WC734_03070 [Patescibacteria group bacterium]|jgi:hypothetical protein